MRIVFAGTPEFAGVALRRLLADRREIVAVYTQPDRPAGRGRKLRASPVKEIALAHQLALEQPETLRSEAALARLRGLRPDLLVVAAYGLILPPAVLAVPTRGCVNIHASLLPRWRGAAPIQRAIMAGDTETGVSIMQMDEGLDTGPILALRRCPIRADDTAGSLHDRLASLGGEALLETLDPLTAGILTATPQAQAGALYARRIEKSESRLDWSRAAVELDRTIRALNPSPVAASSLGGQRLRIWRALPGPTLPPLGAAPPGTVVCVEAEGIDVACGIGSLRLLELQRSGGRRLGVAEFCRAQSIRVHDRFEGCVEHR